MKIDVYQNEINTYFEFERNKYETDETDNIISPNSSWFLLKPSMIDEKMNKYKITRGEVIKLGRITMRVRDIIFQGKNKYNSNSNSILNESIASNHNGKEMQTLKTEGGKTITIESANIINKRNKINKVYRNKETVFDNFDTKLDRKEKVNIISKLNLKKNLKLFSKLEKKNKVCRICYMEEEDDEENPLVQPCICDGSMKYIHIQCLNQWIYTHSCEKLEANIHCSIYLIKPIECELCKTKFPDYIKLKNKFFPLINFTNEYKSYLTLESLTLDKYHNKFIYVVSLEKNKKISIGKNQNCEIILSDRSICDIHCYMIVNNKTVYLEDNDSKFGTLVLIQNNRLKLYQDIPLNIQIGRSFLELIVKREFKLFDCCVSDDKNNIYTYYEQNEKYLKKEMTLSVKDEDEESESFIKNNNTQEVIETYKYGNNSVNFGEKDKMSDNEYLQIKRIKRNKNIKKNMYNDITIEQKEENKSNNNSKEEEDEEIGKVINKNNDAQSEEIKIEDESNIDENNNNKDENNNNNFINNINEIEDNKDKDKESEIHLEDFNDNHLIEEVRSINNENDNIDKKSENNRNDIENDNIDKKSENNRNDIENDRNKNIPDDRDNNNENELVEANNESKKSEIKVDISTIEI